MDIVKQYMTSFFSLPTRPMHAQVLQSDTADSSSPEIHGAIQKEKGARSSLEPRSPSFALYIIVAIGLALFIRFFVAAPYLVQGASMDPTFETWDYLIIDRVSYKFDAPSRGDVVVFRFPQDTSRSFIKRIIGLPGETVILQGTSVIVVSGDHPEGFRLNEPYIAEEHMQESRLSIELGDNEYFVLGDNRKESADSRVWGTLPEKDIVGRAIAQLYPLPQITLWPGEARYDAQPLQ